MGNVGMPKHSSEIEDAKAVLKIFYEANDWMENNDLREKLREVLDPNQYHSSYTKKAQIPLYFGFATCEDNTKSSRKRITESGKRHYLSVVENNQEVTNETIMLSLEKTIFGRNNFGCPSSNSDVDPPSLFIRAALDLDYLSAKEFAYLLWRLADNGGSYTDAINEVRVKREHVDFELPEEASNYKDAKPIMYMYKIGFLTVSQNVSNSRNKQYTISDAVLNKYRKRLLNLKIYNIDKNTDIPEDPVRQDSERLVGGTNVLLYGVPGSGKSHTIKTKYCSNKRLMERVVFHPDYTYSDFIGQILPRVIKDAGDVEGKLRYVFIPGPFTKMLKKALNDPNNMYYLVIEEINRGNAPAIFGEIFQLLDRENSGESEYGISNYDIALEVYRDETHEVKIPSNLSILATMNASDQNVFTLDTAFQRRWNMRLIENKIEDAGHAECKILDTDITWREFNETINKLILENSMGSTSSEDKRLGAYFVSRNEIMFDSKINSLDPLEREQAKNNNNKFPEKVIKYLWDDVFKFNRDDIFKDKYNCLEDVINDFENTHSNKRFEVFKISFSTNQTQVASNVIEDSDEV